MATEPKLKISIVPVFDDVTDLVGQMRRTGESLIAAADSLQRLSDGGPDAARTTPDTEPGGFNFPDSLPGHPRAQCPAVQHHTLHDAHDFETIVPPPDSPDTDLGVHSLWRCPGFPLRPWAQ